MASKLISVFPNYLLARKKQETIFKVRLKSLKGMISVTLVRRFKNSRLFLKLNNNIRDE